jgi:hypothetical protein
LGNWIEALEVVEAEVDGADVVVEVLAGLDAVGVIGEVAPVSVVDVAGVEVSTVLVVLEVEVEGSDAPEVVPMSENTSVLELESWSLGRVGALAFRFSFNFS